MQLHAFFACNFTVLVKFEVGQLLTFYIPQKISRSPENGDHQMA